MFNNVSKKQPWIPLFAILMLVLAALVACGGKVSSTKVGKVANPTPTAEEQGAKPAATQAPETESVATTATDTPAPVPTDPPPPFVEISEPATSPLFEPPAGFKQYEDTVVGVSVFIPESWVVSAVFPGEYAILQSYPEGKYIGGEGFEAGDTKCDLIIRPPDIDVASEIQQSKSDPTVTVVSEQEIVLQSGKPGMRVEAESLGRSVSLITDVNGRTIVLVCFGELAPFDEIAVTLSSSQAEPTSFKVDGRIVFADQGDVFVINADGTQRTQLTEAGLNISPACSPDGQHITFASDRDGNWEIYVMKANGSEQTRLTDNAADDVGPAWSPDGTRIAFVSTRDGNSEIYVMNADGSAQERLMNNSAADGSPDWSPDGKKIAFVSYRDDRWQIYVMSVDGAEQTGLATGLEGHDHAPAWSPDGSLIAFWSFPKGENGAKIYVMNADGSGVVKLTDNVTVGKSNDYSPAWSPDGHWIAFYSDRSANFEMYVMRSDGTEQIRLVRGSNPCWLP